MSEWAIRLSGRHAHLPHPVTGATVDPSIATVVTADDAGHARELAQALFGAHWTSVEPIGPA